MNRFRVGEEYEYKLRFEQYKEFPHEPSAEEWTTWAEHRLDQIEGKIKKVLKDLLPNGCDLTIVESHVIQYSEVVK